MVFYQLIWLLIVGEARSEDRHREDLRHEDPKEGGNVEKGSGMYLILALRL